MKYFYERHLPHYVVDEYAYFITIRLYGSLPINVIKNLQQSYERDLAAISSIKNPAKKYEEYSLLKWNYFTEFDLNLHSFEKSPDWLNNESIASLVKESLHYRDNKDYNMVAYTIMSNHLHLVVIPFFKKIMSESEYKNEYPLGSMLGSIKKFTALRANKILNREGYFWQHESYDHIIRDENELLKIVEYVLNNPVKAGLVEHYSQFKWNYINPKYL